MKHPTSLPLFFSPNQGRFYQLGKMTAIFKADGDETNDEYSVSEWWLEPKMEGPHAHQHPDKIHLMYVIEGTVSFFINGEWKDAEKGTFIQINQKALHTFANRTEEKAGFLNIDIPGGFEKEMPEMVKWFEENE